MQAPGGYLEYTFDPPLGGGSVIPGHGEVITCADALS